MIIDSHTHIFPEKIAAATVEKLADAAHIRAWTGATAESLLASQKRAGIDLGIALPVATSPTQVVRVNDRSARINEKYREEGIFSLGCIHPEFDGWHEELGRISKLGLRGIKLHPVYQKVDIDDIRFLRIIDRAASLGLVVVTHAGIDIGMDGIRCSPAMCRHAVDEIGPFGFVLAHMGGWRNWDEVPQLLADTGVYLDTSFSAPAFDRADDGYWSKEETKMLSAEEMVSMIRIFGAGRILFGTDSPWADQARAVSFIRSLSLTEEEKDDILGGNAQRLFFPDTE